MVEQVARDRGGHRRGGDDEDGQHGPAQDDGTLHDRPCAETFRPPCGDRPCDLLLERHEDAGPGDEPEDPERGEVRVLTRAERPGRDGEEPEGGHPGDEHADGDRHRSFGKGGEDAVQLAVVDVGLLVGRGGPARGRHDSHQAADAAGF